MFFDLGDMIVNVKYIYKISKSDCENANDSSLSFYTVDFLLKDGEDFPLVFDNKEDREEYYNYIRKKLFEYNDLFYLKPV